MRKKLENSQMRTFFSRLCVEILYFVGFVSQYPVDYCEQTRPARETFTFFLMLFILLILSEEIGRHWIGCDRVALSEPWESR